LRNFLLFTVFLVILSIVSSFFVHDRLKFFSRQHTTLLKGIAILTVIWGHIGLAYHIYSIQWIAGIGVALFLICSGYGLEASFNKNGLNNFWEKRIVAVVIPYWIIYLIATLLLRSNFNLRAFFSILLFIKANWYIPYILIVYVIYWCVKKTMLKYKLSRGVFYGLLLVCFTIWFVIVSYYFITPDAPSLLARQMYAFVIGVVFYDYYDKIRMFFVRYTLKNILSFGIIAVISLAIMLVTNKLSVFDHFPNIVNNIISLFTVVPLAVFVIWVSCIAYPLFSNLFFRFMGVISYEVYLIQYFSRQLVNENPITLYICFIVTVVLAWMFYSGYKYIKARMLRKMQKS
jgi:hypothetical protein